MLASKELPLLLEKAVDQPYDRAQIARDCAIVVNNLIHRSADRVVELLGERLEAWFQSASSLDDQHLCMHVNHCSELCGVGNYGADVDMTAGQPRPVSV